MSRSLRALALAAALQLVAVDGMTSFAAYDSRQAHSFAAHDSSVAPHDSSVAADEHRHLDSLAQPMRHRHLDSLAQPMRLLDPVPARPRRAHTIRASTYPVLEGDGASKYGSNHAQLEAGAQAGAQAGARQSEKQNALDAQPLKYPKLVDPDELDKENVSENLFLQRIVHRGAYPPRFPRERSSTYSTLSNRGNDGGSDELGSTGGDFGRPTRNQPIGSKDVHPFVANTALRPETSQAALKPDSPQAADTTGKTNASRNLAASGDGRSNKHTVRSGEANLRTTAAKPSIGDLGRAHRQQDIGKTTLGALRKKLERDSLVFHMKPLKVGGPAAEKYRAPPPIEKGHAYRMAALRGFRRELPLPVQQLRKPTLDPPCPCTRGAQIRAAETGS